MSDDVQRAVVSIADTADNANALIKDVSVDVKQMVAAGARITDDARQIADGIRAGKGTIGKLVTDDELYTRATAIAKEAQEIATNARQVVDEARKALDGFQSKDGPIQGVTADVKQTMVEARSAMTGFAENMEALKHNFLLRGFFNDRGFFSLSEISPEAYRQGALTRRGARRAVRVWLGAPVLFEQDPEHPDRERLTDAGKARVDSAVGTFIDRLPGNALIVEGYARQGTKNEQYLRSRMRASTVRDYLINRFELEPQLAGVMPLGPDADDGVALAVFQEKSATTRKR
jgi:phospholipid/cholesterol/gamma-HCH transport system substrate-binding protein